VLANLKLSRNRLLEKRGRSNLFDSRLTAIAAAKGSCLFIQIIEVSDFTEGCCRVHDPMNALQKVTRFAPIGARSHRERREHEAAATVGTGENASSDCIEYAGRTLRTGLFPESNAAIVPELFAAALQN
jgi:hypothetical protein